ncbi:MAG: methyltransferase domain-containing protein [Pirellulales bacterium]
MATKAYKGLGMEGRVARWYAKITRKNTQELHELAEQIVTTLPPGARILEVAPGPGYLAIELARRDTFTVAGIDISHTFVEMARQHAREQGVTVDFRQGDAAHLPFADASFDLLVCRAAFKNFSEPVRALQEMHRVLAPGGTALIIDLRSDASRDTVYDHVEQMKLSRWSTLMTKWTFRFMLLKRAYTRSQFEAMIAQSGFANSHIETWPIGFEIRLQK